MSTKLFSFAKSKHLLLLLSLFTYLIVLFTSCGNSEVKPLVNSDNCITMSRSALKTNMLAGSWSESGTRDYIPYIYLMPSKNGTSISVSAEPADGNNLLYTARRVHLTISNAVNPPCSFPPGLKIDTNRYDFSTMGFADRNGKLIDFDFLRFVPRACTDEGYTDVMVFDVFAVTNEGGVERVTAMGFTKPCPPYCPTIPAVPVPIDEK